MPSRYNQELADIAAAASAALTVRHQAREQALAISREVIRFSANAIRAVHRGEFEEARGLLEQAGQRLEATKSIRQENPEIYFAGFLSDARKEYAEGQVTLAVISRGVIPSPEELEVDAPAYLNGMAEVIAELEGRVQELTREAESMGQAHSRLAQEKVHRHN